MSKTLKVEVSVDLEEISVDDLVDHVVKITLVQEMRGLRLGDAHVAQMDYDRWMQGKETTQGVITEIKEELSRRCME